MGSSYTPAIATPVTPPNGGTGVANNASSTLTISGNFGTTITVTGATTVTLPTSGTLVASGGTVTFTTITATTLTNAGTLTIQGGGQDMLYVTAGTLYVGSTAGSRAVVSGNNVNFDNTIPRWAVGFGINTGLTDGGAVNTCGIVANGTPTMLFTSAKTSVLSGIQFQLGNNATTGLIAGALAALTTASIVIYDATGTAYRVPCVTP